MKSVKKKVWKHKIWKYGNCKKKTKVFGKWNIKEDIKHEKQKFEKKTKVFSEPLIIKGCQSFISVLHFISSLHLQIYCNKNRTMIVP